MLRLRPYPPRGTTYYLYNQKRIKAIEQDFRFACDALHKIAYCEPGSYTDDQGVSLSCEGCNKAAVIALEALRYISDEYKDADSF
jgi:hypothetical protein